MDKTAGKQLQGWRIVGVAAIALLIVNLAIVLLAADAVEGAHRAIRSTARSSVVLFLLAFSASALWRFWPGAASRWLRQNRRYIGVSFAVSHGLHAVAIASLGWIAPEHLAQIGAVTWVLGGLAYVFIVLMTLTSFDRTAAWIGPRSWKILHTVGSYYVWLIFANSYITRTLTMPEYAFFSVAVIGALILRIVAFVASRRTSVRSTPQPS